MLLGNADVEKLAEKAPEVAEFSAQPLVLEDVTCVQLTAELPDTAREALLPPALHPTIPAAMSLQVFDVRRSPWDAFRFALVRVSCRSGVRARGFSIGAIADSPAAVDGLRRQLGFPVATGDVSLRHGYDGIDIAVARGDRCLAALKAINPEPLGGNDVQFTGTLNLARTSLGLRLLQVESSCEPSRVERLAPGPLTFDGDGWGQSLLQPTLVIACAVVVAPQWTFPPLRFVCKVDELAFTGTQSVS